MCGDAPWVSRPYRDASRRLLFDSAQHRARVEARKSAEDIEENLGAFGVHRNRQGGRPLTIPVNAERAEVLFDVFGTLPGLDTGTMLRAVEEQTPGRVAIWARDPRRIAAH